MASEWQVRSPGGRRYRVAAETAAEAAAWWAGRVRMVCLCAQVVEVSRVVDDQPQAPEEFVVQTPVEVLRDGQVARRRVPFDGRWEAKELPRG